MKPSQRHRAMAHNRGRTRPERALASGLWSRGLRYFTHSGYKSVTGKRLLGNPDLVFPRKKIVLFLDGCFWHGCPQCRKHHGLRVEFWLNKISANKERDHRVNMQLESSGWRVIRVSEHDVRPKGVLEKTIDHLVATIRAASPDKATPKEGDGCV